MKLNVSFQSMQGRTRRDRAPRPPSLLVPLLMGVIIGGGGSFNISSACISLPSFYIALHCTHPNLKIKKRIKIYLLLHNNTSKSFVWSSIALKICFPTEYCYLWFLYKKWLAHFWIQKRWRNEDFKGTSDMPLYKWRVTWNYACIPVKYYYIV